MLSLWSRHLDFVLRTHLLKSRALRMQVLVILISTVAAVETASLHRTAPISVPSRTEMLLFVYKPCSF